MMAGTDFVRWNESIYSQNTIIEEKKKKTLQAKKENKNLAMHGYHTGKFKWYTDVIDR